MTTEESRTSSSVALHLVLLTDDQKRIVITQHLPPWKSTPKGWQFFSERDGVWVRNYPLLKEIEISGGLPRLAKEVSFGS